MKRLLSLCVAFIATIGMWAGSVITYTASAKLPETTSPYSPGIHTDSFGSGVSISSHTFSNGTGTITFNKNVKTIGENAFKRCSDLISVTIPSGVTSIGNRAFYECTNLTSVSIPSTVTSIGSEAFYYCSSLISVTIPSGVTSIESNTFQYCSSLISVSISSGVTSIGNSAFYECTNLTSLSIPSTVTSIGNSAFYKCSKLLSPSIPSSVTTIGSSAFYNIPNIVYSGAATGSPWGAKIVNGYVDGYLVYYDNTEAKIMGCSPLASGAIVIPSTVTQINTRAFEGCTGLTAVHISDLNQWCSIDFGVKETNPLSYAHHLYLNGQEVVDLTIPSTITTIYNSAFYGCYGLKTVTIPNSVTRIWSSAFNECTGLTTVIMPNTVTQIGNMAFYGCSNLTSINISNSVTSIESAAFQGCSALTSIDIPNGVTSIGSFAFGGVRNVNYSGSATGSPWGAKTRNGVVDGFLVYTDNTKTTLSGCSTAATGDVVIPGTVTNIQSSAFDGCKNITSVTIPESMNTIEVYAFQSCTALTSVHIDDIASWCNISFNSSNANPLYYAHHLYVGENEITDLTIPDGVSSIGGRAFYGCSSITSVTIPNTVTSIGIEGFYDCSGLISITCESVNPPTVNSSTFTNVPMNIPLYVPAGSVTAYQNDYNWSRFDVQEIVPEATEYTRDVTIGRYGTICLPKAVAHEDIQGGVFFNIQYAVTNTNDEVIGILMEEEDGDLEAGMAYIFRATADELVLPYSGEAVVNPVATNGLVGNLSETPLDVPQNMYVLSNNQIRKLAGGTATAGQNKAYIDLTNVTKLNYVPAAAPGRIMLYVEDNNPVVTDVKDNNVEKKPVKLLIEGRVLIIRDGKTYDLLGNTL